MKYLASNGIMATVLTEAEAREHFDHADVVAGEFGQMFVTCPMGEYGRLLSIAATTYTPIPENVERDAAETVRRMWRFGAVGEGNWSGL